MENNSSQSQSLQPQPTPTQTQTVSVSNAVVAIANPGVAASPYLALECRGNAKIVAFMDFGVTSIEFALYIYFLVMLFPVITQPIHDVVSQVLLSLVCIIILFCPIEMFLDYQLFIATSPTTEQPTALKKTRIWWVFNILFIVLGLVTSVIFLFPVIPVKASSLIWLFILIRGLEFFFVHKFIDSLTSFRVRQAMRGELVGTAPTITAAIMPVYTVTTTTTQSAPPGEPYHT